MRICKAGGKVLLTTPNSHFFLMKILGLFGIPPSRLQNPEHVQFFDTGQIKSILPRNHELLGFFPYMLLKCRIRKLVGLLSPIFVVVIRKEKTPAPKRRTGKGLHSLAAPKVSSVEARDLH